MNLSTATIKELADELEKRVDPTKPEWDPGAVTVYAVQHGEEGVITKFVPFGYQGELKKPENICFGIYNARILVVNDP